MEKSISKSPARGTKELDELTLGIIAGVKAARDVQTDGFSLFQDLPIIMSALPALKVGFDGLDSVVDELTDLDAIETERSVERVRTLLQLDNEKAQAATVKGYEIALKIAELVTILKR